MGAQDPEERMDRSRRDLKQLYLRGGAEGDEEEESINIQRRDRKGPAL